MSDRFVDRVPEFPGRVKITRVSASENLYVIEKQEGRITGTDALSNLNEGTPLSAAVFNQFEDDLKEYASSVSGGSGGSCVLGESSETAYRGDRGKLAYEHSLIKSGENPHETIFDKISGKPSTLSGYGITDGAAIGKLTIGSTTYNLRVGTSGLAGYITFVLE